MKYERESEREREGERERFNVLKVNVIEKEIENGNKNGKENG